MDRVPGDPAGVTSPPVFVDGFGARYQTFDSENADQGDPVEVLAFDHTLVEARDFANTLGVRVARLANVRHTLFAQVRRLERPTDDSLLLVSDHVAGWRLADVLDVVEQKKLTLDIGVILGLMRQLIPTAALFARHQRELAVGTIGPEHLILTAQGRLVLAEYVLGSAIEKLALSREVLWRRFRVPSTPDQTKISTRSDALGIGLVFLALLHGRRLRADEFPDALGDLLAEAEESSDGKGRPLSQKLGAWLRRALQLDDGARFQTPAEAQVAFELLLASERSYVPTAAPLDAFIANFKSLTESPAEHEEQREKGEKVEKEDAPAPDLADSFVEELVSSVVGTFETSAPVSPPPPVVERREVAAPTPAPVFAAEPIAAPVEVAEPSRFPFDLRDRSTKLFAGIAAAALIELIVIIWLWSGSSESLVGDGELVVQSLPTGATVTLDDRELGTTPVTVRLSPGTYTLKVQVGTLEPRVIPVQIRAGVQTVQYLELQAGR